jgi:hypothetical protein
MRNIKNKKLTLILASLLAVVLVMPALGVPSATARGGDHHIKAELVEVGGSGVSGFVNLVQRPEEGGTHIEVVANGLQPGGRYVSLYYDNTPALCRGMSWATTAATPVV